jgi:hypothetical protein
MADEEPIPADVSSPGLAISGTGMDSFNGDGDGNRNGGLRGKDAVEDEELRKEIEKELNRALFGDEVESEKRDEEKARKVRCSDGNLRGQYEECP